MAVPLYDSQPTRRVPLVTYLLIAANVLVFLIGPMSNVVQQYDNQQQRICAQAVHVQQYGAIPRELTTNERQPLPANVVRACDQATVEKVPWVSAFTSMFLHSDWLHLLQNMIFLFVIGIGLEDRLGRLRYLLSYLVFGLVSVYGFAFLSPDSPSPLIGASGAISGVLGAFLVLNPRGRVVSVVPVIVVPILIRLPVWVLLGSFFVLQWVSLGDGSNVAYEAHIVGFLAGLGYGVYARGSRATQRAAAIGGWR